MQIRIKYSLFLLCTLIIVSCNNKKSGYDSAQNSKPSGEEMIEVNRMLVKKDQARIKNFVSRKGWKMVETETGLWYEILTEGTGQKATSGLVVTINYTLSLLDGTICYSSGQTGPKEFLIGKGNVEAGLEQGILLLNEGGKARLILPPHLGQGLPGDGNKIPARAILIYEIEIVSLKNP